MADSVANRSAPHEHGLQPRLTYARAQGHLLFVAYGSNVAAIDTLGVDAVAKPRLLWSKELASPGSGFEGGNSFPVAFGNLPWRWQQHFAESYGRNGTFGPVTSQYVCFQRSHTLMAVDLRSGETLWSRDDVSPGSDVIGDTEFVLVMSPDQEDATLLRAVDGERLGTCKVPRRRGRQVFPSGQERAGYGRLEATCLAALGRRLLLWWPEGDQHVLTLVDPVEGRDLWPERRYSAAARSCIVGEEAVGVMEPDGHFLLLGLPDGRTLADVKVDSEPGLTDITVLRSEGQYFLITRSTRVGNPSRIQPMAGSSYTPIYRGKMYAFDGQGRLQWPRPAIIQNQFLLLEQPQRLPILTFACQRYQQNAMGVNLLTTSLLCIDKRNGRTAYKKDLTTNSGTIDVVGDRGKKTVDLVLQRNSTIRLTFTDKPLPPGAQTESETPAAPGGEAAEALWDTMRKTIGRLMGEPDDDYGE